MSNKGFTLVEIIIAVLILGVAISPMVRAFAPAIFSTSGEEETTVFANRARGTLNRVLALDFENLKNNQGDPVDLESLFGSTEEADKETFLFKAATYTPIVAITEKIEGDEWLLELTVSINQVRLTTFKVEY